MIRLLIATGVLGFVLNLSGWLVNVVVLGEMWRQAHMLAPAPPQSPFSSSVHGIVQLLSDFLFALVLSCIYRLARPGWQDSRLGLAFLCSGLVWLCGVPMTYLALVNGGYLPVPVAVAATLLALFLFLLFAPLLPKLLPYPK